MKIPRVWHGRIWVSLLVISLSIAIIPSPKARAVLEECLVSVSPNYADVGTDTFFGLNVTNNSSNPIRWLRVTAPGDGVFTVQSGSATGWSPNATASSVTFTTGNLPSPYDQEFFVLSSVNLATDVTSWIVEASDDFFGSNAIACSGNTDVTTSGATIAVSNVNLSAPTDNSVHVTWNTTIPGTSQIEYGTTASYGKTTALDSSMVTSHSATITGLSPSTAYHYKVLSSDAEGNTVSSDDGTFITSAKVVASQPKTAATISTSPIQLLSKPAERTPPTVSMTTLIPKAVKAAPKIDGVADDNNALARIEYSTDGGKNWLPVDEAVGLGRTHATFSFRPVNLEEGNYDLLVRATDISGNTGLSPIKVLVIDRLPPIVGGNILTLGPQILAPDSEGTISSLVGVDQKLTLSAVGGPTSIKINAIYDGAKSKKQVFTLTKSPDTGLWSGVISFSQPGKYSLVAESIDGAGSKTTKALNTVNVYGTAKTVDKKTGKPLQSEVSLYYLEPDSQTWVLWDGESYGQHNPQKTNGRGEFTILLPPGKYYLKATAAKHETLISSIFETSHSKPLTARLELKPLTGINIGSFHLPLPSFAVQLVSVSDSDPIRQSSTGQGTLVGKQISDFKLETTNGKVFRTADVLGKPTLISFGSTWSPTTAEQLAVLSRLQTKEKFNIIPVALQEGAPRVQAYTSISGLSLNWLVDPDSTLSNSYGVQSLPMHYFVNREGVIKRIVVGVLSERQIINIMNGL
ncbi:MAG: redoxin domain-containing protein [Patescibacteria group bacterium]